MLYEVTDKRKSESVHLAIVNGNGLNEVREYKELTISSHQDTFPQGNSNSCFPLPNGE